MTKPPVRLRDGHGPARVLMGGSGLSVPSAARRRALAFTGAAAGMAASGTAVAAAGASSLVKSVVLYVVLGTVGGGVASLVASETISRLDAPSAQVTQAAPAPKLAAPAPNPVVVTPAPVAAAPSAAPAAVVAPAERVVAREGGASSRAAASSAAAPNAAVATAPGKRVAAPSLFEEQALIEQARAALARGDTTSALSTLDGYDRSHAQRQFGPEALALRVEALSSRGDLARARSLAAEFRQRYPHHPLLSRVQAAVQR